ncbi:MAG: copper chaperone PCu(A)C [Gemmatimonas sp.]
MRKGRAAACWWCAPAFVCSPLLVQAMVERNAPVHAVTASVADSVIVTDAWARPALKGGTGGAYMTITNQSGRTIRIVGATSTNATTTELHASSVHDGMAHMAPVPTLVITPGARVTLKPGGLHFMLFGLRKALVKGDQTLLTLRIQNGDQVVVSVAVRTQ